MASNPPKQDSFLNEFQLEGKGTGKIALENWEASMSRVHTILTPESLAAFHNVDWDNEEGIKLSIYCHDCRDIVPPTLKTFGKKTREVCGSCGSKKISKGREEALKKYYRLKEEEAIEKEDTKEAPKKKY